MKEIDWKLCQEISNDPEFFEMYQDIVLNSDSSEDSACVLIRHIIKVYKELNND